MKALLTLSFLLLPLSSSPHIKAVEPFRSATVAQFVRSVYCEAKRVNTESGVPMALILGMCALETKYGQSRRALEDFNMFSVKRAHKYCVYSSIAASFDDYRDVLQQSCYLNLQPVTLNEWFDAITCCHYFQSLTYIKKLNYIILRYRFDAIT